MASAPGLRPTIDYQGLYPLCTRFGLCKAYTEACDQLGVDVIQEEIAQLLVNLYKDKDAKFATAFDGVKRQIQDCTTKKWYTITLSVKESSLRDFISNSKEKSGAFVLNWMHQNGPHCVYAEEWIEGQKKVRCLNSWGEHLEKESLISPGDVTEIYRVSLVLVEQKTGAILKTKTPSETPTTHPHTLTVASTGPAADARWSRMGVYTRTNIWPQWANQDQTRMIYHAKDGRWCIGASTTMSGIRTEQTGLGVVPRKGWMYHAGDDKWVGDSQLEVTAGEPSYPQSVTIKSTGAGGFLGFRSAGPAGVKHPYCMGVYVKQAGEKVWKHRTGESYLFYSGTSGKWLVGCDPKGVRGWLISKQPGLVNIPHSNWVFADEKGCWTEDSTIDVCY